MNNFSMIKTGKRKAVTVLSGRISRKIFTGYYPVFCLYDLDDTDEQAMMNEKYNFSFIPAVIRAGALCSLLRLSSPISGNSLKSSFKYIPASMKDFIIFQPDGVDPIEKHDVDFSSVDTIQSIINRWATAPDVFKENLDVPENRAFLDMGLTDAAYVNIKERAIKEDRTYINVNVNDDINQVVRVPVCAGGLDRACFSELCKEYNGVMYRFELKSGREVSKQKNLEYLSNKCGCSLVDAERLRYCFDRLELNNKTFYHYIFKVFSILVGDAFEDELINLEILAGRLSGFKLVNDKINIFQYNEDGKDVESEYFQNIQDIDLIELNFKDDLDIHNNEYTVKRLSTPEESLHENLIHRIKYSDYTEYLKLNSEFHDIEYGNLKSVSVPSAFSQGMLLMKEKKAVFDKIKDAEIKKVAADLDTVLFDAIKEFKAASIRHDKYVDFKENLSPDMRSVINYSENDKTGYKRAKYRLLKSIYGGEWDGVEVPKVDKVTADMLWRVINKKM